MLRCSAFFIVQLSHPYLNTGKTIALTRQTFVGKIMSLLLNMLSRLVIAFLPRSKCVLISWLQSPSAVILEPPKNKVCLLYPTISSSVVPFSSCPQSFPASESFPMNQLFAWGGQSVGVSGSASVLPMNTQDWSPLGWTGWISLQSERDSQESSTTPQFKSINYSALSFLYSPTLTSIYDDWKNCSFD